MGSSTYIHLSYVIKASLCYYNYYITTFYTAVRTDGDFLVVGLW